MNNFDYYNFQIKYVTEKINKEIDFYQKSEFNDVYPFDEYLIYLKNRLGIDKEEKYNYNYGKAEFQKMNLDEYSKDMDILVFQKPWNKLREFHKIMKIKEYIDNLVIKKQNKKYLKDELEKGLKEKRFTKNKSSVIYDSENMIIEEISCMIYNKKSKTYTIDWNE